jgi:hypothetical protein
MAASLEHGAFLPNIPIGTPYPNAAASMVSATASSAFFTRKSLLSAPLRRIAMKRGNPAHFQSLG